MSEPNGFSDFSESASSSVQAPPKLGVWGVAIFFELAGLWVAGAVFWVWLAHRLPATAQPTKDPNLLKTAAKDL
ncbi:MAG TPA: hypothetical protein PLQ00_04185, partial [Thermoguttaceae bacterium]|nr:hypothetical protein [Thermoguttaceae bacterium]